FYLKKQIGRSWAKQWGKFVMNCVVVNLIRLFVELAAFFKVEGNKPCIAKFQSNRFRQLMRRFRQGSLSPNTYT
ncbi:MAG: hypothetical protein VX735_10925, partial [Pseudomonadota bacterium]|nr:hypothetical protein [Pseudomonadota bacterium]